MKKILAATGILMLLTPAGPLQAKKATKSQSTTPAPTDVSAMTDAQLLACLNSDPQKVQQYQLRYKAKNEILLRGAKPELVSGLLRICEEGPSQQTRLAMETLVDLKSKDVVPVLAYYLLSGDQVLSSISLDYLDRIGDMRAYDAVNNFYHMAGKGGYHPQCMLDMARMKAEVFIPELKANLSDFNIGNTAALALAEMGDKSGRDTALKFLKGSQHGLDITALRALGEIGDKSDLGLVDDTVKKFPQYQGGNADWGQAVHFQIETSGLPSAEQVAKLAALLSPNLSVKHDTLLNWAIDWLDRDGSPQAMKELADIATGPVPFQFRLACVQILRNHSYKVSYQKAGMGYTFTVDPTPGPPPAAVAAFNPQAVSKAPGAAPTPTPAQDLDKLSDEALLAVFKEESEGDSQYGERRPAHLEILMRGKDPALVQGLLSILQNGSMTQKGHAAVLAGELDVPEAVPVMVPMLDDKSTYYQNLCWPILDALGMIGGPQAVQTLTQVFEAADKQLSSKVTHPYPFVDPMRDNVVVYSTGPVGDRDSIEVTAVHQLAHLGQAQLIPELKTAALTPNRLVQPWIARALCRLGDISMHDWARGILTKKGDLDSFTAGPAIDCLGFIGDSGDKDFIASLEQDKSVWGHYPEQLTAAQWQIGMRHDPVENQVLYVATFLQKKVWFMVPWTIGWLGRNGSPEALAQMERVLNEADFAKYQMDMLIVLRQNGVKLVRSKNAHGTYDFTLK
jgi:HEAT repeat protein